MSARGPLVVIGDVLLDRDIHGSVTRLSPDAPVPVLDESERVVRPGGAGLAAALAARDGRAVTLVTALADDAAARELRGELERCGVEVVDIGLSGTTPEKVRFIATGRPLMRLDRGSGGQVRAASAAARAAIGWAAGVLVSDYGRGVAAEPGLRAALQELRGRVPVVWDPHQRGPAPTPGVDVVTPNEAEARSFAAGLGRGSPEGSGADRLVAWTEDLRRAWQVAALCLTRGSRGALLLREGSPVLTIPTTVVMTGDPCGAGDRFASGLACRLADGMPLGDAALAAVTLASAFVASGGAGGALRATVATQPTGELDALDLAERVRAAGGTVVATGGCFDLLHAGHVRTLEAARRLGDCLIVCLNSDASVRRLKGPKRPLVGQRDRTAVLGALSCVDAVLVFDEDTPTQALESLRPDVWAKGGDYEGVELPEQAALARWGGRIIMLPYLDGHSTSRLIEEAATRG